MGRASIENGPTQGTFVTTGRVQLLLESDSRGEPSESKSVDSMSNPCWWRPGSEPGGTDTIMGTEVV